MKCVALGCTSGHRGNPEKVSFFRVPKNKEDAKLWQIACNRKDITLNHNHAFCEKHFNLNDIERKRVFYDNEGTIIEEALLPCPRLKKGAVPCTFSCTESSEDPENPEDAILNSSINQTMSCDEIEEDSNEFSFDQIKYNGEINLPPLWSRTLLQHGNKQALLYQKTIANFVENKLEPVSLKELILDDDLTIRLKVLKKGISHKLITADVKIQSVDQLENIIKLFEGYHVCDGYIIDNNNVSSEFAYEESKNRWRHKDCLLLMSKSSRLLCNYCKDIPYSLTKKIQSNSEDKDVETMQDVKLISKGRYIYGFV